MAGQISNTLAITLKEQAGNYTIEASGPQGIRVDPQPAPQLKTLLSDPQITDTLRELSGRTAPATTETIQQLGKALYDALFTHPELLLAFGKAQGSASPDSGVRLRLQIESTELAALPWETLHDGKEWLSTQSSTPLVRKLALSEDRKPLQKLQIRGALRILFVGASPENLDRLEVEQTAEELEILLGGAIKKKQIVFDKLLNATLEDLQQGLLKDYHILYFAGHGSPEGLFLDDGEGDDIEKAGKVVRGKGDKMLVSAETLAQALEGKQTRLVFLAACETSKASERSRLLRGFAQELVERSNLPAIVAMQYFISDMQANPLTTQFFAALAAGRPVDVALAEARAVLMSQGQVNRDVFSPVLYLQAEDGALFPKTKNWPAISLGVALLVATLVGGILAQSAVTNARSAAINQADALGRDSQSLFNQGKELEAFVQAIKGGKILQKQHATDSEVITALQKLLYEGSERNRLEGHDRDVTSVSFSPDGKTLASGSDDGTIKLWSVETGQECRTLNGHGRDEFLIPSISSVSFSPDGRTLASGSDDGTIKLWSVETGQALRTLNGHDGGVRSVSFSPDGRTLAGGSYNGAIKLWSVKTGQTLRTLNGNWDIWSVSFSPDGKMLVSDSSGGTIKLWSVKTGQTLRTLNGQDDSFISSVSFSPDSTTLASGSSDGTIKLWSVETGQAFRTLNGHDGGVRSVSFSPDGKTLASGSNDGTIKLWGVEMGKELRTLKGHDGGVRSVSFSPDGKTLASGSDDRTIKLWSMETDRALRTLNGHGRNVRNVSFSPDGKTLASGSDDWTIKLWSVETGQERRILKGHNASVSSVSFSPDGKTLASGSGDGTVKLWSVETGQKLWSVETGQKLNWRNASVTSVSFSPDGKTLASGVDPASGFDYMIKLWSVEAGQALRTLKGHDASVTSVSFSPDGKTLASGSGDRTIKLWSVETGQALRTLKGHDRDVTSVSFSPDGKTLASGSYDETIKLWSVETGQALRTLNKHNDYVWGVSFSPDGKTLASGSGDRTIKLWSVETGQELRTLKGHDGFVWGVSFSPDGKTLASNSEDGTIKLWAIDSNLDFLIRRSCDWVRNYLIYDPHARESDRYLCDGTESRK